MSAFVCHRLGISACVTVISSSTIYTHSASLFFLITNTHFPSLSFYNKHIFLLFDHHPPPKILEMAKSSETEHPIKAFGWAASDTTGLLSPFKFSRRYIIQYIFCFSTLVARYSSANHLSQDYYGSPSWY